VTNTQATNIQAASLHSSSTAAERLAGKKLRFLLVDDDPDDLLFTGESLQAALTCDVETAKTGAQALQKIAATGESFDVVLLDNGLPDMSGLDVLSELRAGTNALPVVMVTGFGSESVVVDALRRGASDYVVKTADYLKVLPEVVAQVIERERLRRRAEHLEGEHLRFAQLAAVGEMAAGIAHEIRNPMQVIAGMASLVHDSYRALSPQDMERCTQAIVDNCAQLNRVLEEVLQNVHSSPALEPLELRAVIEETLSFLRFDLQWRRDIEVQLHFETAGRIVGDRDRLKQVLINLFRNAHQSIQMAGKANGILKIALREAKSSAIGEAGSDGAREVIAEITDDGGGISPGAMPHIFESGFSTKGRDAAVKGSGLGLGICRRIVEEHSGHLWAENAPDGGATFFLAFPLAPEPE